MKNEKPFWIIFSDNGPSRKMHFDITDAIDEMKRLSKKVPGMRFYLMKCVGTAYVETKTEYIDSFELYFDAKVL